MSSDINDKVIRGIISRYPRSNKANKGDLGHLLVVAGSYGMMGACELAILSAFRSGVGKVSAYVPRIGLEIIQKKIPEALVITDKNESVLSDINIDIQKYDAIAVGPGIGTDDETATGVLKLFGQLHNSNNKLVIDADALNIISSKRGLENVTLPVKSILTPHSKEFARILGVEEIDINEFRKVQVNLSVKHKVIIVLKSDTTTISFPDGKLLLNKDSSSSLATAGTGDVLTGLVGGLLAQGFEPKDAATLGVYIHSQAGILTGAKLGKRSVIASDVVNAIPEAFKKLEI